MTTTSEDPTVAELPKRADARRNRARVLAAAEAAFAETGLRAPVEEIARRAGVGVGTVCRNFPTKQALVEAVLEAMYEALLADAEAALALDDAAVGFETFCNALADFQARHRALAESMATAIDIPASAQRTKAALRDAIAQLVANAQESGAIRTDVGPADVTMLFAGVAHATELSGDLEPMLHRRYLTIVLDGLRSGDTTTLPGRRFDFAQLDRLRRRQDAKAGAAVADPSSRQQPETDR
ncbi:MAG TPA: helix-turn-helix domain-containing protein [Acidimicrobiia bacterium]